MFHFQINMNKVTDNSLLGKIKKEEPSKLESSWTKMFVNKTNCVCVKRITLYNCLCSFSSSCFSASRARNIGASHIWDLELVITWNVTVVMTFSSRQKSDAPISKKSSVRRGLSFRKKLFVILYSAMQKLNKLSILLLLITNYSSIYSIYLFYLSS